MDFFFNFFKSSNHAIIFYDCVDTQLSIFILFLSVAYVKCCMYTFFMCHQGQNTTSPHANSGLVGVELEDSIFTSLVIFNMGEIGKLIK